MPIRPGTEGRAALAIGKIIVEEDLGRGDVRKYAALYEGVSVSEMAEATDISAETLERLARIFAEGPAQVAMAGNAIASHRDGESDMRAVQALNHILGRFGKPGGVYLSSEPGVDAFAPPPASGFTDVQHLVNDMASGRAKVLFTHGANPLYDLPTTCECGDAMANVPFVVSFSQAVDETASFSDLILPDHTNLESWGYHVPALADRPIVSGMQPAVRPLYDTHASGDVLLALAQKLGGDVEVALPWHNEVEFLKEVIPGWRDERTTSKSFWTIWRRQGGWWSSEAGLRSPKPTDVFEEPLKPARLRHDDDPNVYPYYLQIYLSNGLFDGRGANKSWLQELPDPMTTMTWQTWAEISPHTAGTLGVGDGDVVSVTSRAGEVEALVYLYPGIPEDVIAMPAGQGHGQYGRWAMGRGSNPVKLLAPAYDKGNGALAWGETRVRITPAGDKSKLARLESPEGIEYLRGAGEH